ncbi:hypothetical protein O6H91_Y164500 [Diphasiastrum complanatum]|nr:hypothetical protein O6H91_Y164500 [Diphasiastrum complanatum]
MAITDNMLMSVCLRLLLVFPVVRAQVQGGTQGSNLKQALFIFGDSLVDVGNNNYINSLAKANIPYNGIDYDNGVPTGRFCNGRTVADVLGDLMGIPPPPPYLAPTTKGTAILQGVNYASGAGGILDSTGANYISRISFNQQLQLFSNTKTSLVQILGSDGAEQLLSKAIFYIVHGSNDYINNYLVANSATAARFSPSQYQNLLMSTFSQQLSTLYNLGARKVVVFGVGPLGCIPSQLNQRNSPGPCIQFINDLVVNFNNGARQMLTFLNAQLPGSSFVFGDTYSAFVEQFNNPNRYGFASTNIGCCGLGKFNGGFPCLPFSNLCPDRSKYLFWDPFHPSDAANVNFGEFFFTGGQNFISPINVQQLAAL